MAQVVVKITIQEDEYKHWEEYYTDGVAMVKQQLRMDAKDFCKRMGIRDAEIEVTED